MVNAKRQCFNQDMKNGIVYLLGAGPGDPGLITIRGKELISTADVLIYDALVSPEIIAWAPSTCTLLYVGKRSSHHALPQEQINQLLITEANKGQSVVRLKGGDPYIFGRGGEEAEALYDANIRFEVIPGITSALAGPAYAGIPITHRKHCTQFTVFTGHEDANKKESSLNLQQIAQASGTKVILMGMSNLKTILAGLITHGQNDQTPAAAIQWATTGRQKTVIGTVATLAKEVTKAHLGAPAVVVIGEVIQERTKLNWFESLPLFGKRIVVTRTRSQAGELSQKLRLLGADVIELPTIRITDPDDKHEFAQLVVDAHNYQWLIFTSPNGVDRFFKAFFCAYNDIRSLGGARIAAIGKGTEAKLTALGLHTDILPEKSVAESLLKALKNAQNEFGSFEHCNMLWVRGNEARDVLSKGLLDMQAILDECIAYQTVLETEDPTGAKALLEQEGADIITFTSSSTVDNFFQLGITWPHQCKAASIGPITSKSLVAQGHKPSITAKEHDINGLVDAIVKAVGK